MISVVFILSLLTGAAASAAYSSDNDDFYNDFYVYDDYEDLCTNLNLNQYEDICNDIIRVRDSEAAAAVSYEVLIAHTISMYIIVVELNKRSS